jgi:hypothetical protein
MPDAQRQGTEWRQGQVLSNDTALALGLISPDGPGRTVVVMVSHDCDITRAVEREPDVEFIVGRRIAALGADTNAKTARRLHIAFHTDKGDVPVELIATDKVRLPKQRVLDTAPRGTWSLEPEDLVTLQQWLASRYRRAAFADEFERRLKEKPARLDRKIVAALKGAGPHVLAVFFDVDEGHEVARSGPDDVYQLSIALLYDSTKDEPTAFAAAEHAANAIEDGFEHAFFDGKAWHQIQLLSCTPVSDNVMTIAESRLLKRWRLDHMSLEDDPQQPMLEDG